MIGKAGTRLQLSLSRRAFLGTLAAAPLVRAAEDYPQARISNGELNVLLYLPDREKGFYRSTRFDWSGVIGSLEYKGHNFYSQWFDDRDPSVRDFAHRDGKIFASLPTAMTGPANEFQRPLGFDTAKDGDVFVKIGVAAMKRPDQMAYSAYRAYEVASWGEWSVKTGKDVITFVHTLTGGGYGYEYTKTLRLIPGKADMAMEHRLKNTGTLPIATVVYNHNFLSLDKAAPGPDFEITVPYNITADRPPDPKFAEIRGNKAVYVKRLEAQERVAFPLQGFAADAKDNDFRIENSALGVGVRLKGDRPLLRAALWSIRSVLAIEPFLDIAVEPGKTFEWSTLYSYYQVPKK